jgi:phospholipid-binding lipoprotein MlaA
MRIMSWQSRGGRAIAAAIVAVPLLAYGGRAHAISDPLEPFNRAMFTFNDAVLDYVIEPVGAFAEGWLSPGVRQAAHNMYLNISEPEFIATNLLQGNVRDAGISLQRVLVNTTVGIGGAFDPASQLGLVSRQTELGEAVCNLGVPAGPYLVVPLAGPANVNASALMSGLWVGHLYLIGLISPWLVAADLVIDVSVGAAMLRHSTDPVDSASSDPYQAQRREYEDYIVTACASGPLSLRPSRMRGEAIPINSGH